MTALIRHVRTPVEEVLCGVCLGLRDRVRDSDRVRHQRSLGFEVFREHGLPHRRIEAWHYTDLRNLLREIHPLAPMAPPDIALPAGPGVFRIFIADGHLIGTAGAQPAGLRILPLRDCLSGGDQDVVDLLYPPEGAGDSIVALNAALAVDGVVIDVSTGETITTPVEIVLTSGTGAARMDVSRILVRVGRGARLTLVERQEAQAQVQRNFAMVAHVAEHGVFNHLCEIAGGAPEVLLASLLLDLAAGAQMSSTAVIAGGELVRRQIFASVSGDRASLAISGLSLLDGKQHADTTLTVEHRKPNGTSRELFKHILVDEATGVFQGKVIVHPVAQKTDGGMKSHTLMLGDGPAIYNKPELEIFADDVVCGHGATIGQLDENQLFYLMSRGLPRAEAESLLIEAFAREVVDPVEDEMLRGRFETVLGEWLKRRQP